MSNEYTREWWKERLPWIQAFAEGKRVQINIGQSKAPRWVELCDSPGFEGAASDYRIAPEPKLRPWTQEEIPVGAIIRYKGNNRSVRLLITVASACYVICGAERWEFSQLLEMMEHSTDGGRTWSACGVMEEQQ